MKARKSIVLFTLLMVTILVLSACAPGTSTGSSGATVSSATSATTAPSSGSTVSGTTTTTANTSGSATGGLAPITSTTTSSAGAAATPNAMPTASGPITRTGTTAGSAVTGTTSTTGTTASSAVTGTTSTTGTTSSAAGGAGATYGGMTIDQLMTVKASKPYKLLAVEKTLSNPYWQSMQSGYQKAAANDGVTIDILSVPTEQDTDQQLSLVQQSLAKKYDALMVSPITALNLIPALSQASKQNIPIINVDEKVDLNAATSAGAKITTVVASDNKQAGALAAAYVIKNAPNGGEVAIIEGKAGNPSGQDRHDGFAGAIDASGGKFKVVASQPADWDRAKALDVATNILQSHPNVVAIYACNGTMALGVVQAVKSAGKQGKVMVLGTDAIPEALAAVKSGDMAGTVAQYPDQEAQIATGLAILALEGKPVSGFVPSPIKLLTKNDVP